MVVIEHPSGTLPVNVELGADESGERRVTRVEILRTATSKNWKKCIQEALSILDQT